jgi:radical SAM superfamily enzyme YgiQ (UPF0313 family)
MIFVMALEKLKEPGAILLISCYELGHQPLGLAMTAAFLERAGFRPRMLDLSLAKLDQTRVQEAQFVGISVPMHTALRLGAQAARRVREMNPRCHICCYGLYASLNAEYLLASVADSVIGGEYEDSLVSLAQTLNAQTELSENRVGRPRSPAVPNLKRLSFPVPERGGLPALKNYAHYRNGDEDSVTGYVEATRGCKHGCLHCPIPPVYGGRFFAIQREVVLEDIRQLVASGAEHITFGDPDFLNAPTHSLKIARALHADHPNVTFDFTAKVEHIVSHPDSMQEFARLGCVFAVSAVESLNDSVLSYLEKNHTRADVYRALAVLRQAGISLRPSFVSFTPWTTLDDYIDVLEFVEAENLIDHVDPVQYTIRLLVPPGSLLLSHPALQPNLEGLMPDLFTYRWRHPDPRMDRLHQEATRLVEKSLERGEDGLLTFLRVKELALALREGRQPEEVLLKRLSNRVMPPRLTESWFC